MLVVLCAEKSSELTYLQGGNTSGTFRRGSLDYLLHVGFADGAERPVDVRSREQATGLRYTRALHATQGHNRPDKVRLPVSDGRQQLAVKVAERLEGLPLALVRVDLHGVALQGQHEDAPAL